MIKYYLFLLFPLVSFPIYSNQIDIGKLIQSTQESNKLTLQGESRSDVSQNMNSSSKFYGEQMDKRRARYEELNSPEIINQIELDKIYNNDAFYRYQYKDKGDTLVITCLAGANKGKKFEYGIFIVDYGQISDPKKLAERDCPKYKY